MAVRSSITGMAEGMNFTAKKWSVKPKHPKSICVAAFPEQFKKLHPERGAAGGIKWRSKPKAILDAVYSSIATLFKIANPWCKICELRGNHVIHGTEDVHHSRGKQGLLYFDVRWFVPCCRSCHSWAENNVESAMAIGVTCQKGDWNKETE